MDSTDAWHYALTAFLVLTGLGMAYALFRLGTLLGHVTTDVDDAMREVVPMLSKTSVTLDHVNAELEKIGQVTDTAVDTVRTVDHTARAVTHAAAAPVKAVNSAAEGVRHAFESFKAKRRQRGGVV
jgi:uncharacterized protein YoxC